MNGETVERVIAEAERWRWVLAAPWLALASVLAVGQVAASRAAERIAGV